MALADLTSGQLFPDRAAGLQTSGEIPVSEGVEECLNGTPHMKDHAHGREYPPVTRLPGIVVVAVVLAGWPGGSPAAFPLAIDGPSKGF